MFTKPVPSSSAPLLCSVRPASTFRKQIFQTIIRKLEALVIPRQTVSSSYSYSDYKGPTSTAHMRDLQETLIQYLIYLYSINNYPMSFISSLQKDYELSWKYIIRPPRTPYAEHKLGSTTFKYQGVKAKRHDFSITNSRDLEFACSLWLPCGVESSNCVIYLHGNTSNRLEGTQYLGKLVVAGLGLCTFDFSGCGNAEGQYVSLGHHEKEDLRLVIEHLRSNRHIDQMAIWGRSMGAVTALLYLPQDDSICSVVLDSPFKSLKGLVEDMAAKTSKVPGVVLSAGLKIIDRTLQEKAQFSLSSLNPLKVSPKIFIPAFFIVGVEDDVTPINHTGDLFEAYGGDDKTIKMVNGGHNDNRPDIVLDLVVDFIKDKFQEKKEEEEKVEKSLPETLDSKNQEKEEIFFPKNEEKQAVKEEQVQEKKFSLSRMFSIFSRSPKKKEKEKESENSLPQNQQQQQKELKQQKQSKNPENLEIVEKQDTPSCPVEKKKRSKRSKKKKEEEVDKDEMSVEQKVRQYSYCYF